MADKKYVDSAGLGAVRDWADDKFQPKLPEISATDNGKVLSVVEGQWEPTELQEELPEVTSADNGKVLAVVAGEWEKAEAPDGLPPVQSADNGKVLTVVEGEWAKADVPDELPAVSASDNGKVLGVVEGQWAKTEPEDGLPEVTSSDNGKVLSVVEGAWAPAVPTGGSGLPEVTSADNGDILSVVDGAWAKSEPEGPGYEVVETVIAPEQSVTTIEDGGYVWGRMTATWPSEYPESITVTFNGTEYTLPKNTTELGVTYYGEYDNNEMYVFTNYPCAVEIGIGTALVTETPGIYTVSARSEALVPSDTFKEAVKQSGAPGYDVSTEEVEIAPEQSVTTVSQGPHIVGLLTATVPDPLPDSINVTFNGTSYENVPKHAEASLGSIDIYGDIAFSEYPFAITFADGNLLLTQTAGTYTIAITGQVTTVTPDNDFKAAVKASGAGQAPLVVNFQYDTSAATADKTFDEILAAWNAGRSIVFNCENYPQPEPAGFVVAAPAVIYDNNGEITFQANYTYVARLDSKVYTIIMSINSMYTVCYYSHT